MATRQAQAAVDPVLRSRQTAAPARKRNRPPTGARHYQPSRLRDLEPSYTQDLPPEEIERRYTAALAYVRSTQPFELELFKGGSSLSIGAPLPVVLGLRAG